jgi:hypothetical protein
VFAIGPVALRQQGTGAFPGRPARVVPAGGALRHRPQRVRAGRRGVRGRRLARRQPRAAALVVLVAATAVTVAGIRFNAAVGTLLHPRVFAADGGAVVSPRRPGARAAASPAPCWVLAVTVSPSC